MFIGRTAEMSELNRLYGTGSFEMPVIYGRRRVGKTRLITEFIQGKKAIYFQARRTNAEANLHGFSQAILAGSVGAAGVSFRSLDEAFDALATMARTERLIVVIDEYPYLAQSNPEISSLLQDKIDHLYKETKLSLSCAGRRFRSWKSGCWATRAHYTVGVRPSLRSCRSILRRPSACGRA